MKTRVLLFAIARQLAGRDAIEIELPDGATVAELRRRLAGKVPELTDLLGTTTFAIDAEYVDDATTISAAAEVACIPPVSGG